MASVDGTVDAKPQAKCGRCSKNARLQGIEYCSRCLSRVIEKRVSNSLKAATEIVNRYGKQNQPAPRIIILCDENRSLACASALYLAKKMLGASFAISVAASKPAAMAKGATLIYPQCSDEIAVGLVQKFISSPKNWQRFPVLNRGINIFDSITENELRLYAGMKRIKYAQRQENGLKQALRELQEKLPGTVEAIAKSAARLDNLEAKDKK